MGVDQTTVPLRGIYICSFEVSRTLSYLSDWADTFENNGFEVFNAYNANKKAIIAASIKIQRANIVVIGFSCLTGLLGTRKRILAAASRASRATVVGFLQNEFRNFSEMMRYLDSFGLDVLVSQLPTAIAQEFYSGRSRAKKIVSGYHGLYSGIEPKTIPYGERPIDIGSRVHEYGAYLGNNARDAVIPGLLKRAEKGGRFSIDWATGANERFSREQWLAFLGRCRLTVASEAGSRYIQWNERKRLKINRLLKEAPKDEQYRIAEAVLLEDKAHLSGLTISPRIFDAIHTRTCQVLVEGRYNGILQPGEHFIELRRDLSNLDAVLEQMSDRAHCEEIADRAYRHAMASHTLDHRFETLMAKL